MNKLSMLLGRLVRSAAYLWILVISTSTGTAQAEVDSHQDAYALALGKMVDIHARLISEMEQVRDGRVAHFDYLQNEHIELLRYASALRFPPAALPQARQAEMVQQAEGLLSQVSDLEWVIADFLRSHARAASGLSNTIDLATMHAAQIADPDKKEALLQVETGARMLKQRPENDTLQALELAFSKVDYAAIGEQASAELEFQRQLILKNALAPEQFLERVRDADLLMSIQRLEALLEG